MEQPGLPPGKIEVGQHAGLAAAHATAVGHVEIDGAYFGGKLRHENRREDRKDLRLKQHQTGKCRVVMVMRERNGRTLPFVVRAERV